MKALVKRESKRGLWMEDRPVPEYGPRELLIRIKTTSVCGTDLHIYEWDDWAKKTIPVPITIGHEFVGVVEKVGADVKGFQIGDRVSGEGHITCGHCRNCRAGKRHLCRNTLGIGIHRDGCFAEYLSLPADNAFRVHADISDKVASIFDPLGNAVHTALSFNLVGEDVLITGAGPIGLMATKICQKVGARHVVITDVNEHRLEIARTMGATLAVNAKERSLEEAMKELGMTEGFDIGLEMSGNSNAFQSMLNTMNNGGRVALLGIFSEPIAIDWTKVIFKGLHLKGIYGREMFETWYKMGTLLESGLDVSPVITHEFPADSYETAFETIRSGQCGKILLNWSN